MASTPTLGRRTAACLLLCAILACGAQEPAGWPMHRGDAGRTGFTPDPLPDRLRLQWTRRLPAPIPAWKDEGEMKFDRCYEPVVLGKLLFVASNVNDRVAAYDLQTGEEKWRFYCDGPVRVAPAAWRDRLFVASDDGCLYALSTGDGKLLWKHRGGPSSRRLVGNERVISTWPARGGPVVADGKVYYAAGVWPFMGVFVHALDAETGKVVWTNDSVSFTFRFLPHPNSAGFSGLSPQGHLALAGDRLIVPNSRTWPAIFEARSGRFVAYGAGSSPYVRAWGGYGIAGGAIFSLQSGFSVRLDSLKRTGQSVFAPDAWHASDGNFDPAGIKVEEKKVKEVRYSFDIEAPVNEFTVLNGSIPKLAAAAGAPLLRAGKKLLVAGKLDLQLVDVSDKSATPKVLASLPFKTAANLLAADGRLIAVTAEGEIQCYGEAQVQAKSFELPQARIEAGAWAGKAAEALKLSGAAEGYALVWGLADGGLAEELARQSKLHVIAVEKDARKVEALRRKADEAGWYGTRLAAIGEAPLEAEFAPYLAGLVAVENLEGAGFSQGPEFARRLFAVLRPYGGTACLPLTPEQQTQLSGWVREAKLAGAEVKSAGGWTLLVRAGPPAGAGAWLGQNCDAGNTRCSRDELVQAPLGVLWYGNSLSNRLVLPRHGEGPVQQVAGGRYFIEGPDSLSAADVYTGRLLWTRDFTGLGKYFVNTGHQRGAHAIGSNFFAVPDAVYVARGPVCHVLDPAGGQTARELKLPENSEWFFLLVYQDLLVAGLHPEIPAEKSKDNVLRVNKPAYSKGLAAMERATGKALWTRKSEEGIYHYGIVAGNGRVFYSAGGTVFALEAKSGRELWKTAECAGVNLAYSEKHDILISAGGALRGKDGSVLWKEVVRPPPPPAPPAAAPPKAPPEPPVNPASPNILWEGKWGPILNDAWIINPVGRVFELSTGRQKTWVDANGQEREWTGNRSHGCGPAAGSTHLRTFRSGDAGYYDWKNEGGTANLGGFRSGCTSNLIVGDGVLTAPDYTRTCTCDYANRSSLGLIHMPEVEYWTYAALPRPGRVGLNFGAPGDRRAADGTLFWAFPVQVHSKYARPVPVKSTPEMPRTFYHHSSRMNEAGETRWIGPSGLEGVRELRVVLPSVKPDKELYLRLVFCEPEYAEAGRRIFSISLDGKELLSGLDIFKETGAKFRSLVKEFKGLRASSARDGPSPVLLFTFAPKVGEPVISGLEVVEQERMTLP